MFVILLFGTTYPLFSWLNSVIVSQKIPLHQNVEIPLSKERVFVSGAVFIVYQNPGTLMGTVSI